ncbi:MAG: hypothetical protein K2N44_05125 [Lachnospiraceae bacterium]|nr:hypothetical protein [Lachnospiraceae bacterium]
MLISEKCDKIMELIPDMGCKQCVILGIIGMARTIGLVKHISAHKQFKKMSDFDIYIHGGIKKVLYNDLDINKKLRKE